MICFHVTYRAPPGGAAFNAQRQWKLGPWTVSWFRGTPAPACPLTASAPSLLAALEDILEYDGGADNALQDRYVMERAHDAVALARGERAP